MKIACSIGQRKRLVAFTRLELVIVVLVVTVLILLIVPGLVKAREKSQRIRCASNLMQIGSAMNAWAVGNTNPVTGGDRYPVMVSTNFGGSLEFVGTGQVFRHFQAMSNALGSTVVLVCPSDSRRPSSDWRTLANSNISYFISVGADETTPNMLLAGDRHLDSLPPKKGGVLLLTTNTTFRWGPELHSGNVGNVALSDGSVQQPSGALLPPLTSSGVTVVVTNRLEFP